MSATRPGDEPGDEPDGSKPHGDEGAGASSGRAHPESPLDDLFVVGAKYHEPSAAERASAAKAAERASKKASKAHEKEIARTRRVLDGDQSGRRGRGRRPRGEFSVASFERRNALIGLVVIVAISVALSFTAFAH